MKGGSKQVLKLAVDCKNDIILEINKFELCWSSESLQSLITFKKILQDQKKIRYEDLIEIEVSFFS